MNINNIKRYLKEKPLCVSFFKNKDTTIYKVNGKIFAILSTETFPYIILKNEPFLNKALRESFSFVFPAIDVLNKMYWNTIILVKDIDEDVILSLIDRSYELNIEDMNKRQKRHYKYEIEECS